ncbi:hypothetical protein OAK99_01630 [Akkermansiaceae bacterium]|nr:hypothetical protein [Akkermansiaceae bacterium]
MVVLQAKQSGELIPVGRVINVSVIYSMLAVSSLLPFMPTIWKQFKPRSVIRWIIGFQIVLLAIPFSLIQSRPDKILLLWFFFVFVLATLLLQYACELNRENEKWVTLIQIITNFCTIGAILSGFDLIIAYFIPYQFFLVLAFFLIGPFSSEGIKLDARRFASLAKKFLGFSILLSLAWPVAFYFLRENYANKSPKNWEDLEFTIRIGMSVLGLVSAVILNYKFYDGVVKIEDIKKRAVKNASISFFLLGLGFLLCLHFNSVLPVGKMFLILAAFGIKIITLFYSYLLIKTGFIKFILAMELTHCLAIVAGTFVNFDLAGILFFNSVVSFLVIIRKCKKVLSSPMEGILSGDVPEVVR